ncbi:hypothetical protein [Gramella sp. Hel_I_59]|uniref:hypothetical protein n=1 Tax=Gramella sp. Hel_I_59 TaxID=1249978 RepID=UPI001153FCE1|nr:hypothetical protein [Gramella sp. Hel_I_59]
MMHYYFRDDTSDRFHDLELVAWKESKDVLYTDTNTYHSSFTQVEEIRLHASKGKDYKVRSFKSDFGKNSCIGSHARNVKELDRSVIKDSSMWRSPFKKISRDEYESFRNELIEIYQKELFLDLDNMEPKEQPIQELVSEAKEYIKNSKNTKSEV